VQLLAHSKTVDIFTRFIIYAGCILEEFVMNGGI
jgi:hypothetical protein